MKLAQQVAVVTGAGQGIGRAVARKLAAEGARIVVNDLDVDAARAVASELCLLGSPAVECAGDVTAPGVPEACIDRALQEWSRLDVIVNNAGHPWDATIQNTSDAQFQRMLDLHVVAPFRMLRAAAEPFRRQAREDEARGVARHRKVVNVSSISGLLGNAGQVSYSTAKSALTGMTRTLAREWARHRVNVNAVAFGLIDTRLSRARAEGGGLATVGDQAVPLGLPEAVRAQMLAAIPLGRFGTVEEAAGAIYLLTLPESDYITAEVLTCSGGLVA